jgi:EmrB/QacA subfamily drug resistance transporter
MNESQITPGVASAVAPAATSAPAEHAPLDQAKIRAIMVGILLAMFLSALEQTIVAPALPTIGRALADVENLPWVVTSYLLASTAMTPLFGKLSDIYGRRRMMLVAIVIFLVGSAACALAPNMWTLIAARAVQGIGGGGILPLAHTILGDMVSPRERARYQSYTSIMFMVASISGPVLGGVLTDYVHWTMIFWINLPLGLVALWMTDRALRALPRNDRRHKLDVLGAMLMICAALALMLAMTWGGQTRGGTHYGWMSWPILSLLAGSCALWLLFSLRVARAPEPFIPLSILREPIVAATAVAGFFSVGVIIALSIFLPLYFELVLGFTPSGSGTALIVFLAAATAGSFIAGRLMMRFTHYKWVPLAGLALGIVMLAVMAAKPAGLSLTVVCLLLALGGTGLGAMYPVTTTIVQNAVAPHQLGTATGALNFARQLGGTIIVAAFGAIVLGGIDTGGHGLTLEMLAGGARRAGAEFATLFGLLFAAGAVFLVAGLVAMLLVEERPLRGPRQDGGAAAAPAAPVAAE